MPLCHRRRDPTPTAPPASAAHWQPGPPCGRAGLPELLVLNWSAGASSSELEIAAGNLNLNFQLKLPVARPVDGRRARAAQLKLGTAMAAHWQAASNSE